MFSSTEVGSANGSTQARGEEGSGATCSSAAMNGTGPDLLHGMAPSRATSSPSSCPAANSCREDGGELNQYDSRRPWVALGKHLCGAASDFMLRCTMDSMQNRTGDFSIATTLDFHCTYSGIAGVCCALSAARAFIFSMSSD
jgi:Methyltransferase TRM13